MSSAILVRVFSFLELYGHTWREQGRGWLTGAHALVLPTHFKASSGRWDTRRGIVMEGMHDSLETMLSLFYYLACGIL